VLRLESVHAAYGAIVAIRGVTLAVEKGELVALIGVNGAGKTTLLSTIAGTVSAKGGDILFENTSIAGLAPEMVVRKGIAMVPEDRDIFSDLTVEENLRLGGYLRRRSGEYAADLDRMCELFPVLKERLNQDAGTLSGGEQQQLAIARALMSHPRLLMLDEPSLGLAPKIVDQVFDLIEQLHEDGTTILLVEQNVTKSLAIADRAYLLHMGAVQASGSPMELRHQVDLESIYLGGTR